MRLCRFDYVIKHKVFVKWSNLFVNAIVFNYCLRFIFFFKEKTAYEMRISDWSSDVCSSDLVAADYRIWARRPQDLIRTNVEGTRRLMAAALRQGVERVVYTSSVAVLGKSSDGAPADEDTAVCLADMIGAYKRSKFLAEEAVCRLQREEGLPGVIVNPSTPFGP